MSIKPYNLVRARKSAVYKGRISLNAIFIGAIFVSVMIYVAATNQYYDKGYDIRELKQQIQQLEQESKDLNSELMKLQAGQNLSGESSAINMVPAQDVSYLKLPSDWVAKK